MNTFNRYLITVLFFVLCVPLFIYASEKRYPVPIGDSPSWGPANAPVTIIEFLDYQ